MSEAAEYNRAGQIARSTIIVMASFAAAKAISLLQTVIIARAFGISAEYDAFVAANRLPEIIFNLIAGGAIAFAFIPVFTGFLAKNDTKTAWKVASHVANTVFLVTLIVSAVVFVLAPSLVSTSIAPGFAPETQAQTADMMRILLVGTILFSISGMITGILQGYQRFLLPALAPIMYDLGILFGVLFLIRPFGIYGLALGAVLGAALHLIIQLPGLFRVGVRWTPRFGWNDKNFRAVLVLFLPRALDLALVSFSALVITNILSRLGEGATSAYDWGWRIMQIPETLIGTAMGIVIFPTLAALSSLGDLDGKRSAFSGSIRFILVLTIPSAMLLIASGRPLLGLLEGGAFDQSATDLVYSALLFFSIGIVVHSVLEIVARSFYADKDTLTPLIVAVGGATVNIGIALVFSGVLTGTASPESVGVLAFSNTLGVTFEVVAMFIILRRRWGSVDENHLAKTTVKTLAASLIMALVVTALHAGFGVVGLSGTSFVQAVILVATEVIIGLLVFIGAAYLVQLGEVKIFITQSVQKLRSFLPHREAQTAA
jgi:putative peptidoglycan lipid II flippase